MSRYCPRTTSLSFAVIPLLAFRVVPGARSWHASVPSTHLCTLAETAGQSPLKEDADSKDWPMQSRVDLEGFSCLRITLAEMHSPVSHRQPEMTGELPFGARCCRHIHVG